MQPCTVYSSWICIISHVVTSNTKKNTERRGPEKASVKTSTAVAVQTRILELKGEPFCESNCKLFCQACREVLGTKASIIKRHITSEKHKSGKTRLSQKEAREATILKAIKKYENEVRPEGETLSDEQRVYRVKVVKTFLKAGILLEKLDSFCVLLEEGGYRLTTSSHMRQLIPLKRKEEEERIKSEISASNVAVIFDGTQGLGKLWQ